VDSIGFKRIATLIAASFFICGCMNTVYARQNIVIGDLSVGYELRERNYDDRDIGDAGDLTGDSVTGGGTDAILVEDRTENRNRYFVEPRLTVTSTGITDQVSLTYAPRINFEEDDYTNHIDHDFGLLAEKNFSRNWSVSFSDNYFLGDDSLRESTTRTAVIGSPTEVEGEDTVAPAAGEEDSAGLTERVGTRRFWRNDLNLSTEYIYREDSLVGMGYSYDMLRNVDDDIGGYTEYDRYDAMLRLSYRFNQEWRAEAEGHYIRGIFDDNPEVTVARVTPGEGEITVGTADVTASDDLQQYDVTTNVTYDWTPHDDLFVDYHFLGTEYDHPLREDIWLHEFALGLSHDFTSQLHLTVSGGPSIVKRENRSWENDYNVYAGLTKDFFHSSMTVYGEKGHDQESFDGRRSGFTDFWRVGASYDRQITENLTVTFSGAYRNSLREQPPAVDAIIIIDDGNNEPGDIVLPENFEYTDKFYDAGVDLSYSFMRWYTVSGGYRYSKRDSDLIGSSNYDEHRFFITLTATKEFFRW